MMGSSHAMTGVILGCSTISLVIPHQHTTWEIVASLYRDAGHWAWLLIPLIGVFTLLLPGLAIPDAWLPNAPPIVLLLTIAITGGAALLPDLDHPSSTVARSIGPLTKLISRGLAWLAWTIYHTTRLPGDPGQRESGHRLITHTPVGSLGFALIATASAAVHPIASGIVAGLCCGLLGTGLRHALRRFLRALPRCFRGIGAMPGIGIGSAAGIASWHTASTFPAWSWALGIPVLLGCLIHREGDWCTNSGVPRRAWPLPEEAGKRRWKLHKAPVTFDTGGDEERFFVWRLLVLGSVTALAGIVGIPAALPEIGTTLAGVAR